MYRCRIGAIIRVVLTQHDGGNMSLIQPRLTPPVFPREFAPDSYWFTSCLNISVRGETVHNHNSCFLLKGGGATVLIDTAVPFGWQELKKQLAEALRGRPLDFIFATHPEAPHMGNAEALLCLYPGARLAGDLRNYELYLPGFEHRFLHLNAGDRLDLGGRELIMVTAAVHDLTNTLWAYDPMHEILFVSDGYPYTHEHQLHQCAMTSEELPGLPGVDSTMVVISGALGWTRYVPAEQTIADLEAVLREYPPRIIAPAHGGIITNPAAITDVFKAGLRSIYGAEA